MPEQQTVQATQTQPVGPKNNVFAIASFVLGLVSLLLNIWFIPTILAIVFGILALVQIPKKGQKGKWMAITGLILGVVGAIILIVLTVIVAKVASTVLTGLEATA